MMTMWSIADAPLFIGTDLRTLPSLPGVLDILGNEEVLAVNSEPGVPMLSPAGYGSMVVQGHRVSTANSTGVEIWAKFLQPKIPAADTARGGILRRVAVAVLNRGTAETEVVVVPFSTLDIADNSTCEVRDLWCGVDLGSAQEGSFNVSVSVHEAAMFILSGPGCSAALPFPR
jgi:hypothetical protein